MNSVIGNILGGSGALVALKGVYSYATETDPNLRKNALTTIGIGVAILSTGMMLDYSTTPAIGESILNTPAVGPSTEEVLKTLPDNLNSYVKDFHQNTDQLMSPTYPYPFPSDGSYPSAIYDAESYFLQESSASSSENNLLEVIKKTHKFLIDKLAGPDSTLSNLAGKFRSEDLEEVYQVGLNSVKDLPSYFEKIESTPEDLRYLSSAISKINQYGTLANAKTHFNFAEFEILKKAVRFPTQNAAMEMEMGYFATCLNRVFTLVKEKKVNPVAAAAWVYQKMISISPFSVKNEQIANVVQNSLLKAGGIQGVINPRTDAFDFTIFNDHLKPGLYTEYLFNMIKESRNLAAKYGNSITYQT